MPMFAVAAMLMLMDFDALWRYFAWTNQTLAMVMLWTATVWLRRNRGQMKAVLTLVPALFMTVVCVSYIIYAPEGLRLPQDIAIVFGVAASVVAGVLYFMTGLKRYRIRKIN